MMQVFYVFFLIFQKINKYFTKKLKRPGDLIKLNNVETRIIQEVNVPWYDPKLFLNCWEILRTTTKNCKFP